MMKHPGGIRRHLYPRTRRNTLVCLLKYLYVVARTRKAQRGG